MLEVNELFELFMFGCLMSLFVFICFFYAGTMNLDLLWSVVSYSLMFFSFVSGLLFLLSGGKHSRDINLCDKRGDCIKMYSYFGDIASAMNSEPAVVCSIVFIHF
jgi:hypothetical protein